MNQKNSFVTTAWGIGLLACLCCLLWGSATPAIKIGYEWFDITAGDIASRILFAGVRFIIAGIQAAIFGSLIARKPLFPQKTSWGMIWKLSLIQTVFQYIFFYMGLAYTTGVKSAIINKRRNFHASGSGFWPTGKRIPEYCRLSGGYYPLFSGGDRAAPTGS